MLSVPARIWQELCKADRDVPISVLLRDSAICDWHILRTDSETFNLRCKPCTRRNSP